MKVRELRTWLSQLDGETELMFFPVSFRGDDVTAITLSNRDGDKLYESGEIEG